jgi:sugar lactone lactonase YvrE
MNTLYISTARYDMTPEDLHHYPDAGDLYAICPETGGVARHSFKE